MKVVNQTRQYTPVDANAEPAFYRNDMNQLLSTLDFELVGDTSFTRPTMNVPLAQSQQPLWTSEMSDPGRPPMALETSDFASDVVYLSPSRPAAVSSRRLGKVQLCEAEVDDLYRLCG